MRIVSLVPSATELLFALGVGDEVTAVTHECDHPPEVLELPKVTRDVIGPGLPPAEPGLARRPVGITQPSSATMLRRKFAASS